MRLLPLLFDKIAFLRVEYAPDGSYRRAWFLRTKRKVVPYEGSAVPTGSLVVAVVCGSGVVTKPDSASILERVRADEETFLRTSFGGTTSFVRRSQLEGLLAELAAEKIYPFRVLCTDAASDFTAIAEASAATLCDSLKWKELFRFSESSSAALQTLTRRCALPVLGIVLCLLVVNTLYGSSLNSRRQQLQMELERREQSTSKQASASERQQKLLAAFQTRPPVGFDILCDRIAAAVPDEIRLTGLEIEPPVKRFEAGKPLLRRDRAVFVSGSSKNSAAVSRFTGALSELSFCQSVRLTSVEKERDGGNLHFLIEIGL